MVLVMNSCESESPIIALDIFRDHTSRDIVSAPFKFCFHTSLIKRHQARALDVFLSTWFGMTLHA